jgi:hypothetical protein
MHPHMVRIHPFLNSNARVRYLRVSLPLVACLVDGRCDFLPDDLPPPAGQDLRAFNRPRIAAHRTATPRSSSACAMREAAAPTAR